MRGGRRPGGSMTHRTRQEREDILAIILQMVRRPLLVTRRIRIRTAGEVPDDDEDRPMLPGSKHPRESSRRGSGNINVH